MKNTDLGKIAEKIAFDFFQKNDFLIIQRNFRAGRAEIDLIVSKENVLVFVEVKYRKNSFFGNPEDFVSDAQKERIRYAAEIFLETYPCAAPPSIRFDILAIEGNNPYLSIEHFEDAF